MSGPIKPITTAPAAFSGIVEKLNEVIAANPPLQAGKGIKIDTAKDNRIVSVNFTEQENRLYTQALTVAGVIPTSTEIATGILATYTANSTAPRWGDIINFTVGGVCKIRTTITTKGTASGVWVVAFTFSTQTYYGQQVQTGLY